LERGYLRIVDDISGLLQKGGFGVRKSPFFSKVERRDFTLDQKVNVTDPRG
jgi:hypothetical protein